MQSQLVRLVKGPNLLLISLAVAAAILFVFGLAPLGEDDAENVQLTKIYFADNISKAHEQVIARFNQRYEGQIQVVPVDLPFAKFSTNERKELLTRSFRSKTTRIDVFAVDLVWVSRFSKWAVPLASYFPPTVLHDILPYALEPCYYDSQLVSVPFYIDVGLLYYRKDLLRTLSDFENIEKQLQNSISWEEFLQLHQRLALKGNPFYLYPADNYEGLICSIVELVRSQGASFGINDSVTIDTPQSRRALQLLADLVHKYQVTPQQVITFKENDVYEYALQHDAVFFRGWPGNLSAYRDQYPDKTRNLEVAALPHLKGAQPASVYGGWNLMISKYSEKQAAAVKFIEFALSATMQKLLYEEMGFLPISASVYGDSTFIIRHPELRYYLQLLANGVHRPALTEYTKISDILSFYANKAIAGELTVPQALQLVQQEVQMKRVVIN